MDNIKLYIVESYNELMTKVTWPTWASLLSNTRLVLVATVIISLIIFIMDLISKQILTFIYGING